MFERHRVLPQKGLACPHLKAMLVAHSHYLLLEITQEVVYHIFLGEPLSLIHDLLVQNLW